MFLFISLFDSLINVFISWQLSAIIPYYFQKFQLYNQLACIYAHQHAFLSHWPTSFPKFQIHQKSKARIFPSHDKLSTIFHMISTWLTLWWQVIHYATNNVIYSLLLFKLPIYIYIYKSQLKSPSLLDKHNQKKAHRQWSSNNRMLPSSNSYFAVCKIFSLVVQRVLGIYPYLLSKRKRKYILIFIFSVNPSFYFWVFHLPVVDANLGTEDR